MEIAAERNSITKTNALGHNRFNAREFGTREQTRRATHPDHQRAVFHDVEVAINLFNQPVVEVDVGPDVVDAGRRTREDARARVVAATVAQHAGELHHVAARWHVFLYLRSISRERNRGWRY